MSSLDASVRGEVLKLILGLRDSLGAAALIVSHDLGVAWNIADRIAVMYLGRIGEVGPVSEVLLRPRRPYTRALISVLPDSRRDQPPAALPGEPPDPTAIPAGCWFHPRCPLLASLPDGDPRADRCRNEPVPVLAVAPGDGGGMLVACHLAPAGVAAGIGADGPAQPSAQGKR